MPKITYRDIDKSAPVVTWFGVEFKDGEIVDLDQHKHLTVEQKAEMVMRANASAFYKVEGKDGKPEGYDPMPPLAPGSPVPGDEAQAKAGREAADSGKKRDAYKPAAWLAAFDERMEELEKEAKHSKNTHPRR